MSASSKKKLRKEQQAAKLTEKQQAAQKEAKKLSFYTTTFVIVIVALLVIAVTVGANQTIRSSGILEKNTVALTVGDHEITTAELNYFYYDAINEFKSTYGNYAGLYFGLDLTVPLDQQYVDEAAGLTWADDFLNTAISNAKTVYAIIDAAEAEGFTLDEEEALNIEYQAINLDTYAGFYGYENGEAYLKAMYGNGATMEGYIQYCKNNALANAYTRHYSSTLVYEDSDLRAKEAENPAAYSSYSFNTYYIASSRFLTGGTTNEDGTVSYSDEEKAASVAAAEAAAKSLVTDEIVTVEDLDAAIAALPVNAGTEAASQVYNDTVYSSVNGAYAEWLSDAGRQPGDKAYFANTTTSTVDGVETTTVNGYYVVYYISTNDNTVNLVNVRHILVPFSGGTADPQTGSTVYSDEDKAATKATADQILAEWKAGPATEDSFAEMANAKSADGDGTTGGLYEKVYPGQMVANFNDWCFDEARVPGDTAVIETEYGYHIMYFVSVSDYTYRDFLIENDLRNAAYTQWFDSTVSAVTVVEGNTKYIKKDIVLM